MNRILAIETSSECCSVALAVSGEVQESFEHAPMKHAELILPQVSALLAEAGIQAGDLDAIAFGRGPGSFTSLRIGIGVVQGLAWGAGVPVVPVSSLAAVAQGVVNNVAASSAERGPGYSHRVFRDDDPARATPVIPGLTPDIQATQIVVAMDARMGEVFHGTFTAGGGGAVEPAGREGVCAPSALEVGENWIAAGNGFERYEELTALANGARACLPDSWPRASAVLKLARNWLKDNEPLPAHQAQPVYIRNDVAQKPESE